MTGKFLKDVEAAEFLGVSVATLRKWRCRGRGPRWRAFGRAIRYATEDLNQWVNSQRSGGIQ
jgi:excisionase family DNA binding protein